MSKAFPALIGSVVVASSIFASGCTAERGRLATFTPAPHAPPLGPARNPDDVPVVKKVKRPYVVLGEIAISPDGNTKQARYFGQGHVRLIESYYGAKLGCDAVLADKAIVGIGGLWEARASCVRYTTTEVP